MIPGFHEEIINITYYVYFLRELILVVFFWGSFITYRVAICITERSYVSIYAYKLCIWV